MKKIIAIIALVCVIASVGVVAFNMGENHSDKPQDYDYTKIIKGDFSDFVGLWENGEGYTIDLKSDGTEGGGEDYYSVAEDIEYKDGYYNWGVIDYSNADNECWGGYAIWLYPVGVEIVDEYTGEVVPSDTNQVRLYAGQDFFATPENIYYK